MKHLQRGLSIVEFLISITLGAFLVAMAGSVYLTNKTSFRIQQGLAKLQENGRYANYFLNHQLRMAGYQGCAGESFLEVNNLVSNPGITLLYDNPLKGYDGISDTFSPALPTQLEGLAHPASDAIEVRMAANTNVQLRDDLNRTNNPILVFDKLGIQAGDVLMVSNCLYGDIFVAGANTSATAITHTVTDNISNHLSFPYTAGAHVMRYAYYAFYIKDTGRTNTNNEPVYALIRQDLNGNEVEIVEGVERMSITYGVDTNDDKAANLYQTATEVDAANKWNDVISLKINLLLATTENLASKPQSYQFNGANYLPGDRKLRREWQSIITIRNRGLPS